MLQLVWRYLRYLRLPPHKLLGSIRNRQQEGSRTGEAGQVRRQRINVELPDSGNPALQKHTGRKQPLRQAGARH